MKYLYHGSTIQNLKKLEPKKRYTPAGNIDYAATYATPLSAYAATHAFPWSSDEGVDLDVVDGHVVFVVPKKFKERLKVPISIYKVPAIGLERTKEELTGYTWHTVKSVDILQEKKYESVEQALKELEVELRYKE